MGGRTGTTAAPSDAALDAYEAMAPGYDAFTGTLNYEPWLAEVLPRLERFGLAGNRLLDVGCGTAKSMTPMLDRGWEVVGCDISPAMIEIARRRLGERARVEVADMRELPRFGSFELVWSLNDSINYLLSGEELASALRGMGANLAPGGLLVFDVNALHTYRTFFAERLEVENEGMRFVWAGMASTGQPPGTLFEASFEAENATTGAPLEPHTHRQRHFPEAEVLEALAAAGLECLGAFGQDRSGELSQPLREDEQVKALYVARQRRSSSVRHNLPL